MNALSPDSRPRPISRAPALGQRIAAAGLDWIVPQWPVPASVNAFVTTRNAVACAEAFLPSAPFRLEQVHGALIVDADAHHAEPSLDPATRGSDAELPRGDGAVTRTPGVVLTVRFADCLPVLFADTAATVIGIAHAGWRGLAAGVLENAVSAMRCEPATLLAWFGPAIGKSAFEVGADVHDAFVTADADSEAAFAPGRPGKWFADLEALARMLLRRSGVSAVHGGSMCTASDPARFHSFRRDRATGRMAAFVWREDRHA